jgi:hypothetical protein
MHADLDMRKFSEMWALKFLNADQKHRRCQSSEQIWNFFVSGNPNDFLSRMATTDGTWLYCYDPKTKQQSMDRRHSGSPRPQKFQVQKSAGKFLAAIF